MIRVIAAIFEIDPGANGVWERETFGNKKIISPHTITASVFLFALHVTCRLVRGSEKSR